MTRLAVHWSFDPLDLEVSQYFSLGFYSAVCQHAVIAVYNESHCCSRGHKDTYKSERGI
jgi:hypothetical protein